MTSARFTKRTLLGIGILAGVVAGAIAFNPQISLADADKSEAVATMKGMSDAFASISEAASPAVVGIRVSKEVTTTPGEPQFPPGMPEMFRRFFGPNFEFRQGGDGPVPRQFQTGMGSGFIVSEDGYIITNHHVVGEADKITVNLTDGREMLATVVGTDPRTEVALIKVDAEDLPALELGDSDALRVGDWVMAIGSPYGLSHSVTAGIVSALGRGHQLGLTEYPDFIQTDAAINLGNSGGPLLNLDGEVVGVNTAIFSRTGGSMGIGFAIPINMARYVKDQLIEHGEIRRGYLGVAIQNVTPQLAPWFDSHQGVLIGEVVPDSPADKAGLQQGDVIVEFDGHEVTNIGPFRSRIASTPPDSAVNLGLVREGRRIEKRVELGQLDEQAMVADAGSTQPEVNRDIGLQVQNLTDELAQRFGYTAERGVLITQVARGSQAFMAGLEPGMLITHVNRKPVANVAEFRDAVRATGAGTVLLLVTDGDTSRFVALRLNNN